MHLSNSYFRCNKSYKNCTVKGTITISFLFEKELFFKFVTLKTEITPWVFLHFISEYPCFSTKSTNNMKEKDKQLAHQKKL